MFETTHLQRHFDELSDKKWTLLSFNSEFSQSLLESAKIRLQRSQFRDAQLAAEQKVVPQVRNDQIFWLDAKLNALNEAEKEFLNWLNDFCHQLRTDLRVSLREVECHYAYYDKGHFYQKHRDVTSVHNKRVISFVLYLNPNWKTEDGGFLIGYQDTEILFQIKPELGQMILFQSELEHEVETTQRERVSITGWFRK